MGRLQELLQGSLEERVTELLGRVKLQRRGAVLVATVPLSDGREVVLALREVYPEAAEQC